MSISSRGQWPGGEIQCHSAINAANFARKPQEQVCLHVSKLVHAYNATRNEATGFLPFYLLFGWEPTLPIDTIFQQTANAHIKNHSDYARQWQRAMKQAYEIATEKFRKSQEKGRNYHSATTLPSAALLPEDQVLVRSLSE